MDLLKRTHYTNEVEAEKSVVLNGWVSSLRDIGSVKFLILRDMAGTIQITAKRGSVDERILKAIDSLNAEDVVAVKGKAVKNKSAPGGLEVVPSDVEVLSKSEAQLPIDIGGKIESSMDKRLDWRVLDFRNQDTQSIFKIQAQITKSFRDFFGERGYLEMQPPCIISSSSEGGAELFPLIYFDKEAFLAQSPQLYKQMGAISFEKVFCILPVFRAEKFNQPTHLNEIRQLDVEEAFADDEGVMKVLEEFFVYVLQQVKKNNKRELEILKRDLKIPKLPLKHITYTEAIEILKKKGEKIEWGEDFSKTQEKLLHEVAKEEAFFIKDWPSEIKAFYAMPYEDNPKISRAFDLIYNGLEIASGTQRVHDPKLLEKRIKEKGLNVEAFRSYIDSFCFGAPYHAGWSIGLERLTMKICGKANIRECTMFPRDRNRLTP